MRGPLHLLTLGIYKARGDGESAEVLRKVWKADEPPSRADFHQAVEEAYASIDRPYLPCDAWVTIANAFETTTVEASDPQDEAMVAARLWAAIVTAAAGYG